MTIEPHYILFYKTVDNYIERRAAFRDEHIRLVEAGYSNGSLVMAGAMDAPPDGAVLIFKNENDARSFANHDPYVKNGLIIEWHVRKWNVVGKG